ARAGQRAAVLTQQLLTFSRQQILTAAVLDLNSVLTDLEPTLRSLLGPSIELVTSLEPQLRRLRADPQHLEQLIKQFALKAHAAMPAGGGFALPTRNLMVDEAAADAQPELLPGPYVVLTVADNGHGMNDETRARIFDPFFTTRPIGQGSGLGLAAAYGFVKQ